MNMTTRQRSLMRPAIVEIISEVFQYDGPVTPVTGPDQIERWDSLQHIALIRTIEEHFGIALSMDEMMEIRTAGDIEMVLARHGVGA